MKAALTLVPFLIAPLGMAPMEASAESVVIDLFDAPGVERENRIAPASTTSPGLTPVFGTVSSSLLSSFAASTIPLDEEDYTDTGSLREYDGGYEIVTAALASDPFYVAGVTWAGAQPVEVDIRVMTGDWSDWYTLEMDSEGVAGTEPFITAGATAVQVRILGTEIPAEAELTLAAGTGEATPAEPELAEDQPAEGTESDPVVNVENTDFFVPQRDVTFANASLVSGQDLGQNPLSAVGLGAPNVTTRAQWGTTRVPPAWKPVYVPLQSAIIHHTAGTNDYQPSQSAAIVRGIHDYHTFTRKWDDIGYNYLVDKFGRVFEGRYGTLASPGDKMVVGGHAAPANTGSLGISVMGTYMNNVYPSAEVLTALENTIAWRFGMAGVNPNGTWVYKDRSGRNVTAPTILGHKDVSATACPGNIYPQLGRIRANVGRMISDSQKISTPSPTTMKLYKTDDFAPISRDIQHFGSVTDEFYVGNVLGNGDLPFVRRGNQFFFAATSQSPTASFQTSLGTPGQEVYVGSVFDKNRESVILRTGNTFSIYDNIYSNTPTRVINYGRAGDEVFVFDWDGDGLDEIAVRRGNQFYLKWTVLSGNADRVITYGRVGDEVLPGKWSPLAGAPETLTVRRGNQYHMMYTIRSGNADYSFGYGRATDRVVIGDWNRDGRDGVGVVRKP